MAARRHAAGGGGAGPRHALGLAPDEALDEADWHDALWAQHSTQRLRGRYPDHAAFAAEVLHLSAPDATQYVRAVDTVRRAVAAGRDERDFDALASFDLEQRGALSPHTLLTDEAGRFWGRRLRVGAPRVPSLPERSTRLSSRS